jgi:hypothetical protein
MWTIVVRHRHMPIFLYYRNSRPLSSRNPRWDASDVSTLEHAGRGECKEGYDKRAFEGPVADVQWNPFQSLILSKGLRCYNFAQSAEGAQACLISIGKKLPRNRPRYRLFL